MTLLELPIWQQTIGIWSGLAISIVAVLGGLFGVINFIVNAAIDKKVTPVLTELKTDVKSLRSDMAEVKVLLLREKV